ncbi:GNAT family N-acetyltransferase [Flavobacterium sp.]|jgi:predicted GNAT family acetyltransferase|uniref:GNAT family N-acetyltransferase n=1 Tax=Flavobacterium sp. TaxID=239 RepID=UPI0037C1A732
MKVVKVSSNNRFELEHNESIAFIEFDKIEPNILDLVHTEVPKEVAGNGVGSKLVEGALQYCKQNDLNVIPSCAFVKNFINKHPEWNDFISKK